MWAKLMVVMMVEREGLAGGAVNILIFLRHQSFLKQVLDLFNARMNIPAANQRASF